MAHALDPRLVRWVLAFALITLAHPCPARQTCNDVEWYRVTLAGHQGPNLLHYPPLNTTLLLDPEPWEWTGQSWRRLGTPYGAAALAEKPVALAYDPIRNRVVAQMTNPYRTWEWDGQVWQPFSAATLPYRESFAMAFDPNLGQVVIVGGYTYGWPNPPAVLDDMWAWNGSLWARVPSPGLTPRFGHALGVDPLSGRLLLHAGRDQPAGQGVGQTLAWDGSSWSLVALDGPAEVEHPTLYADIAVGRLRMLYTAATVGSTFGPPRLYEWNGSAWTDLGEQPIAPRRNAGVAYDPTRQRLVVSGGSSTTSVLAIPQTWEFDGTSWVAARDETWLTTLAGSMAYDQQRDRIVTISATEPGVTALFDGHAWERVLVPGPPPRLRPAMAYDQGRGVVVLHAGVGHTDTWEWNGSSWAQVHADGPPASWQTMAYDPIRQRCLLVNPDRELWAWDGLDWTRLGTDLPITAGATNFIAHSVAFDHVRDRLVVHPSNQLYRTAEWNGSAWSLHSYNSGFNILGAGPLVFDTVASRVLRFGGLFDNMFNFAYPTNYTVEWDGSTWFFRAANLFYSNIPPRLSGHPMVWDSQRQRAVFLGVGIDVDTWAMRRINSTLPSITAHPVPRTISTGGATNFAIQVESFPGESFRWYRDNQPLSNGAFPFASVNGSNTRTLFLFNVNAAAAGVYHCVATNDCGSIASLPAILTVICPADLTTGATPSQPGYAQPDGRVDSEDFFFYLNAFAQGNLAVADLTTTGAATPGLPGFGIPDGQLNADDFVCYLIRFAQPC